MNVEELIKIFNTDKTHIEIDTINQHDNGMTTDKHEYTYTFLLVRNENQESLEHVSVEGFCLASIKFVHDCFEQYLLREEAECSKVREIRINGDLLEAVIEGSNKEKKSFE